MLRTIAIDDVINYRFLIESIDSDQQSDQLTDWRFRTKHPASNPHSVCLSHAQKWSCHRYIWTLSLLITPLVV